MVTVVVKIELQIPGVTSLKEKRRVLKSLLAGVKNKFNISIAEVADNDVLRRATIGAAVVSNNAAFGHQVISQLVNHVERFNGTILTDYLMETY